MPSSGGRGRWVELVGGGEGGGDIEINTAESQQTFHGYLVHFPPTESASVIGRQGHVTSQKRISVFDWSPASRDGINTIAVLYCSLTKTRVLRWFEKENFQNLFQNLSRIFQESSLPNRLGTLSQPCG